MHAYIPQLDLKGITEEGGVVALLSLGISILWSIFGWRLVFGIAAGILAAEIDGHENLEADAHGDHSDEDGMSGDKLRGVLGQVDKSGDSTSEITCKQFISIESKRGLKMRSQLTKTDVHGNADTTLDAATNVVAVPGHTLGNVGVDSHGEEETTGILDMGVLRRDQHNKTKDRHKAEADHEDASSLESVGRPAASDTAETSNDVWWDSHQLCGVVGVSEGPDNGW